MDSIMKTEKKSRTSYILLCVILVISMSILMWGCQSKDNVAGTGGASETEASGQTNEANGEANGEANNEANNGENSANATVSEVINIGTLNGPTGMGMVQLMGLPEKYNISTFQSPTDINGKIISGELDVAAVPSNVAAVLYAKTEGKIKSVSPIVLGVLHIVGNSAEVNSVADLGGKTIIASGQGGTPEYVLQKVLEKAGLTIYEDVKVEWLANHTDVNAKLQSEPQSIAMLPEPFVTVALASGQGAVTKIFDMNELWADATGEELPMGVLVASDKFLTERGGDLQVLLNDYAASVEFVNSNPAEASKLIVEKGLIAKEGIAESAIKSCQIVLFSGNDEKIKAGEDMLRIFWETLYEMNPASVGGSLPDESIYYNR